MAQESLLPSRPSLNLCACARPCPPRCADLFSRLPAGYMDDYKNPCWMNATTEPPSMHCLPYYYILGARACRSLAPVYLTRNGRAGTAILGVGDKPADTWRAVLCTGNFQCGVRDLQNRLQAHPSIIVRSRLRPRLRSCWCTSLLSRRLPPPPMPSPPVAHTPLCLCCSQGDVNTAPHWWDEDKPFDQYQQNYDRCLFSSDLPPVVTHRKSRSCFTCRRVVLMLGAPVVTAPRAWCH